MIVPDVTLFFVTVDRPPGTETCQQVPRGAANSQGDSGDPIGPAGPDLDPDELSEGGTGAFPIRFLAVLVEETAATAARDYGPNRPAAGL
jgi:hypothetical protein